jgi:hypothetical protein
MPREIPPIEQRFWSRVDKRRPDECWPWTAGKDRDGYGQIAGPDNKQLKAHRLSYAMHAGQFPTDLNVLHRCDNPSCVNPGHLFLGTAKDNVADRMAKGRSNNCPVGEDNPLAKLSNDDIREIRRRHGEVLEAIASDFGLSLDHLKRIITYTSRKIERRISAGRMGRHLEDLDDETPEEMARRLIK